MVFRFSAISPLLKQILSEIYILDGVELPSPTAADVSWEDVHDQKSGRTQDARMHIFRIARKRKVALKYDVLTQKEMAELQRLLDRDYYQFLRTSPPPKSSITRRERVSSKNQFSSMFTPRSGKRKRSATARYKGSRCIRTAVPMEYRPRSDAPHTTAALIIEIPFQKASHLPEIMLQLKLNRECQERQYR